MRNHLEAVKCITERLKLDFYKCAYEFIYSAEIGDISLAKAFLDAKIDPNTHFSDQHFYDTPLLKSAENGHLEVVNALLEADANVDQGVFDIIVNPNFKL